MKIINEKGKLFGLINVVDLLVILFVLLVAGGVLWKFGGNTVKEALSDNMTISYVIRVNNVEESFYEEVLENVPARLMTNGEMLDGEVIAVEKKQSMIKGTNDRGENVYSIDEGMIDLFFTLTSVVPKNSITMKVGSQEVRTGIDIRVKTRYYEFLGTVISVDIPND